MTQTRRVVWSDGLLITPQHLQQSDAFHESQLNDRFRVTDRHAWGLSRFEIDPEALRSGHLVIRELSGVLPDGTTLVLGAGDDELPATREVAPHFTSAQGTLPVFITIAESRAGVENFAFDGDNAVARYAVRQTEVPDLVDPSHRVQVSLAARRVELRLGNESLADHIALQVAEIGRDEMGGYHLVETYVPPCLQIGVSPFIVNGLQRLLGNAVSRQRSLASARRETSRSTIEFNTADTTRFFLLRTVNAYLPLLKHWCQAPYARPRELYMGLSQMAGELCTFSTTIDPGDLPPFDYGDLRTTFETLFARLTQLLLASVEQHSVIVELEGQGSGMFRATLQDPRLSGSSQYLLAVKSDVPPKQISSELPKFAKVASWREIERIVSAATPGAAVEVCYQPPPEVLTKTGFAYFGVAADSPYWKQVEADRELAVYLPPFFTPEKTTVQLVAVIRESHGERR